MTSRRILLVALASLALCAPAAVAAEENAFQDPMSAGDLALAQERSYSTYAEPTPAAAPTTTTDGDAGIAMVPFVLAVLAAMAVGLGAGSRLHLVHARRPAARPAL